VSYQVGKIFRSSTKKIVAGGKNKNSRQSASDPKKKLFPQKPPGFGAGGSVMGPKKAGQVAGGVGGGGKQGDCNFEAGEF